MFSTFNNLKIRVDGASHSERITLTLCGIKKGEVIDLDELQSFVDKRKPSKSAFSTPRKESDKVVFESGIKNGISTGEPIVAYVENKNQKSNDYESLKNTPRPSHADYTARMKFGDSVDLRGGGKYSGRLTVALTIAGSIAKQILEKKNIKIGAYISRIGKVDGVSYKNQHIDINQISGMDNNPVKTLKEVDSIAMLNEIEKAKASKDSVGGVIECIAFNVPVGLGDSLFDGLESKISANIFAIPAVKGVEFGSGFGVSQMLGSECNDEFYYDEDCNVRTYSNNNGGINGGITNGQPLTLSVAIKPTPSIGKEQRTINLETKTNTTMTIGGRHDSCIVPRAIVVVESAVALSLLDSLYGE